MTEVCVCGFGSARGACARSALGVCVCVCVFLYYIYARSWCVCVLRPNDDDDDDVVGQARNNVGGTCSLYSICMFKVRMRACVCQEDSDGEGVWSGGMRVLAYCQRGAMLWHSRGDGPGNRGRENMV